MGVGAQSRGTIGGLARQCVLPGPPVTPAQEASWWQRRGVAMPATARMSDGTPSYLYLQATEMTFVQPLSAVSFLASLPAQPCPSPHPSLPALGAWLHQTGSPRSPSARCPGNSLRTGSTVPQMSINLMVKACSPFIPIAALIYFISKLPLCDDRLHYSVYKRQSLALISSTEEERDEWRCASGRQWDPERGRRKEGLVGLVGEENMSSRGWGETSLCPGNGCLEANQGRDRGEGGRRPHLLLLATWLRTCIWSSNAIQLPFGEIR